MIFVILPAYNEEAALPPLLASIAEVRREKLPDMEVFVVDDGSQDSTAHVVEAFAVANDWVKLAAHGQNKGLSQAIQTGFGKALERAAPNDLVITLDADNTQPPDHMVAMHHKIAEEGYDVIVASRFQPGARVIGLSMMRRLYSFAMSLIFRSFLPIRGIRDYSCGYRAYRASALQSAYSVYGNNGFITEQGFACMVEILLQLNRLGTLRFGEVAMILRYDLKPTDTKMRVVRTIRDTLRLAMRFRFGNR